MKGILIRAAAFDLNGTLVHSASDLAAAANVMLETLGYTPLPERRIARLLGGGIDRLVDGVLAESTGHTAEPVALAMAAGLFRRRYAEHLFECSRVYPGVADGLRGLRALGIKLCCVTNKRSTFTLPLLDATGLAGYFAFALCADPAEARKPAPDLLIAACERLEVDPCELLYVGDSCADIAATRAAGCFMAVAHYGYDQGHSLPNERPDWLIGSLGDLVELPTTKWLANTET